MFPLYFATIDLLKNDQCQFLDISILLCLKNMIFSILTQPYFYIVRNNSWWKLQWQLSLNTGLKQILNLLKPIQSNLKSFYFRVPQILNSLLILSKSQHKWGHHYYLANSFKKVLVISCFYCIIASHKDIL